MNVDKETEFSFYIFLLGFLTSGFFSIYVKFFLVNFAFNIKRTLFILFFASFFMFAGFLIKGEGIKKRDLKNYILWNFFGFYLVLYVLSLQVTLNPSFANIKKIFFFSFLTLPLPFFFSGVVLGKIVENSKGFLSSIKLLLVSFALSPLFIFFILSKRLNTWFSAGTLGIIYIGFLLVFIEKGKRRLIPILFVVPVFAFMIVGNKAILKKMASPYKPNLYFESEQGTYFIVFGDKKVNFYKNLFLLYSFPFKKEAYKKSVLKIIRNSKKNMGSVLILGENPKIVDIFLSTGLFKIYYSFEDRGLKENILYNYPSIIVYLKKAGVKILNDNAFLFLKKNPVKFDLILFNINFQNFTGLYKEKYFRLLNKSLKNDGLIIVDTKDKIIKVYNKGKLIFEFKKYYLLLFLLLGIILVFSPFFIKRKGVLSFILLFGFIMNYFLAMKLFSLLSEKLYSYSSLLLFIILFSYYISFLFFEDFKPSRIKISLFSLFFLFLILISSLFLCLIAFYIFLFFYSFFYFPLYFKRIAGTSGF